MQDILNAIIAEEKLAGEYGDKINFNIEDAYISKENQRLILNIRIGLNFVLSLMGQRKLEKELVKKVSTIDGTKVFYNYQRDSLIMKPIENLYNFIPIVLEKEQIGMAKATRCEDMVLLEDTITIPALGAMAELTLNNNAKKIIEHEIKEVLNYNYKVKFVNYEEGYEKAEAARKIHDKKVMEEHHRMIKNAAANAGKKSNADLDENSMGTNNSNNFGNGENKTGFQRRRKNKNIIVDKIPGASMALEELKVDSGNVSIEGTIFGIDTKPISHESYVISLFITNKKTSAKVKFFTEEGIWAEMREKLSPGQYVKVKGNSQLSRFDNSLELMATQIALGVAPRRMDNFHGLKRIELHAHTKMSDLDGLNEIKTLVNTSADWGHTAVAITDHGVVQGFPDAFSAAEKCAAKGKPIQVIFGMEGYVFEDKDRIDENGNIDYKGTKTNPVRTNHIILIAKTQEGLKNLYKLVSIAHIDYFYRRPRLPKSVIRKHREGLLIGSACEAGEVFMAVRKGMRGKALEELADFYDYLEIQPLINDRFMISDERYPEVNDWEDIRNINRKILELGDKLGKPVVATTDAHYDEPESAIYRNIIMKGKGFKDAENGEGLYMRTTQEMLEEFKYLGEENAYRVVVENTNKVADLIDKDIRPVPLEKCPPKIDGAEETLRETCMSNAYEIYGNPLPPEIQSRLETELNAIIGNGYAVMYVSAQMLVKKSLEDGYLVGSRGSVGSSFAATMAGITEVNPLDPHYICPKCKKLIWGDMQVYDCGIDMPEKDCPVCGTKMKRDGFTIPFATFLGFKGNKEPDIDLNFAGEYQGRAHKYVGEIFGEENVFKAGTVGTIAEKTAAGYVSNFAAETQQDINPVEKKRLVAGCEGVKRTTGQHPGGIVIVPDDREIFEFCPIQRPANDSKSDVITTHFDYHKIDQNLLKLDILGHNVPSMIRHLQDMTGIDPLEVDLSDRSVLSIFNGIEALDIKDSEYMFKHGSYAIPEFGTPFVRQMLDDAKPDKFADLVRISGFSHGTDVWLNNAQDYIRQGIATMREVISTRDDIMNYLILKGIENETSFKIMEDVRKNRPLKPEQLEIMKAHGVPDWYIDSCIKIKYMFPRAHAVAYVMMSFRLAWYKVYYPAEFYATVFSSDVNNFNADVILKGKQAVINRMEEIKRMGNNATTRDKDENTVLEIAYEMYSRGIEFKNAYLGGSRALKFWVEDGKVLLPFAAFSGVGETAAKSMEEEYNKKPFDTIEDAMTRAKLSKTVVEILKSNDVFGDLPETDQICWNFS